MIKTLGILGFGSGTPGGPASQGPRNGGTVVGDGFGPQFSNLNNILGNSGYASVSHNGAEGFLSETFTISNFGFSIPNGATIDGIEVSFTAYVDDVSGVSSIGLPTLLLYYQDTAHGVLNNAGLPSHIFTSATPTVYTWGGPTNKWRDNFDADWSGQAMTPAKINNSTFSISTIYLTDDAPDSGTTIYIKNFAMKVYYTV